MRAEKGARLSHLRYIAPMAHERISRDPDVMMGKPCIRGTRITVQLILEDLADGMTPAEIAAAYGNVTEEDVRAAAAYAAAYLSGEGLVEAE